MAFDRWSTHKYNRALRKGFQAIKLQACPREIALSRRDQDRKQKTCASSCVCTSPLAVTTVVVFLDFPNAFSSSELKSISLSMGIDAPESTANSRSSGDFEVGASIGLVSVAEVHNCE